MAQAIIVDDKKITTKIISPTDYPITKISSSIPLIEIQEILPFRVKLTTIGIEASNNFPGIGLQVIGVNNYIM